AVVVVAPALDGAAGEPGAGVDPTGGDLRDVREARDRGRRGSEGRAVAELAMVVRPPAVHRPPAQQRAGVGLADEGVAGAAGDDRDGTPDGAALQLLLVVLPPAPDGAAGQRPAGELVPRADARGGHAGAGDARPGAHVAALAAVVGVRGEVRTSAAAH